MCWRRFHNSYKNKFGLREIKSLYWVKYCIFGEFNVFSPSKAVCCTEIVFLAKWLGGDVLIVDVCTFLVVGWNLCPFFLSWTITSLHQTVYSLKSVPKSPNSPRDQYSILHFSLHRECENARCFFIFHFQLRMSSPHFKESY